MFDSTGSHQKIRHPGPPAEQRIQWVQGQVQSATVRLPGGTPLTQAVAMAMHRLQGETAFFQLDGLQLRSGNHVLPAASVDGQHVAWYSDTKPMGACTFLSGTVVVGRKDDDWFLHCHALWKTAQGTLASGHVLCADACIAEDWDATFHVFKGGGLRVTYDAETRFSVLRPCAPPGQQTPSRQSQPMNAVLLTLQPHQDVRAALNEVSATLCIDQASVMGVGSLIGAEFANAPAMASPLSEMFLMPGADISKGQVTALPVACVDPMGALFQGELLLGKGPVLITCEMLMTVKQFDRPQQ